MRQFSILPFLLAAVIVLATKPLFAQKREATALRTNQVLTVDGKASEAIWKDAVVATEFYNNWPYDGKKATLKTEVRILYNDFALYVFVHCFDKKDSVSQPLNKRDDLNQSDWVGLLINPYQDGQNATEFDVMPSNVQFDSKYSGNNEDDSWDAVWTSATQIVENGWTAEFEIPFAALRFPKKDIQTWDINFSRKHNKNGQLTSWCNVDPNQMALVQLGKLNGIQNVKTPIRLSATPFVASSASNTYNRSSKPVSSWSSQYAAGLDLKYGINDAFTLDATIIPDFAQVRSDNKVLNISPYEVQFNDYRPFFMEGTELFNKGGLFYSRRIGGQPIGYYDVYDQLADNEEIAENPTNTQLINAFKITGRTKGGTGIGVFNAVEAPMSATVKNRETGQSRQISTSTLTDKTVFVVDQNLKNNSVVTLISANTLRKGNANDANTTGLRLLLKDKKNVYAIFTQAYLSQIFTPNGTARGSRVGAELQKTSGRISWNIGASQITDSYNPNDMGYLYNPNKRTLYGDINYSENQPKNKLLNSWWGGFWGNITSLQQPQAWNATECGINIGGNTKNFQNGGLNINGLPWGGNDYFEPRTADFSRYFHSTPRFNTNFWYNSDNRKKGQVSAGGDFSMGGTTVERRANYAWVGYERRFGSKLSLGMDFNLESVRKGGGFAFPGPIENALGYTTLLDDSGQVANNNILFSKRDILSFDNGCRITYTFNNKMNLSFRARHYWYRLAFKSFYLLQENGRLGPTAYTGTDAAGKPLHNLTAAYFNIDCIYTWRFAPGSDIIIVWKNALDDYQDQAQRNYLRGLKELGNLPQNNNISLKVLYWLDYTTVKRRLG